MSDTGDRDRSPAGVAFDRLVEIMRTLRSPEGCAWDRQQTLESLRPFVLEEAYEVVDAIDRDDTAGLKDEIGDLVLEAVFLAQVTSEQGTFAIQDAVDTVCDKLVRRHPHVFGDGAVATSMTPADVKRQWEEIKAGEQASAGREPRALGGVPPSLPSLLRAYRLGRRAATVGFDWTSADAVAAKVDEELAELREARRPQRRKSLGICCSPSSTSLATSTSNPSQPSVRPTASLPTASASSSAVFASVASPSATSRPRR